MVERATEGQEQQYPEYVENEYTETVWVRRDLAASGAEAVAYINREFMNEFPDELADGAKEVHIRLYPPDHPDAPTAAKLEGADWFQVVPEASGTCAYWQVQP